MSLVDIRIVHAENSALWVLALALLAFAFILARQKVV